MIALNAPLCTGQILSPRKTSAFPKSKITNFYINGVAKLMWKLESLDGVPLGDMSLEDIYREFWFDDNRDPEGPKE